MVGVAGAPGPTVGTGADLSLSAAVGVLGGTGGLGPSVDAASLIGIVVVLRFVNALLWSRAWTLRFIMVAISFHD